ncbi:hypothetical protein [uncultured Senegalimassilia sp.]|uniref:hypothetical protein n=1 Tax=uncultured Senegalimassilia sp. TaxID=1714350 RepID=UPI0026DFEFCD|nr:hypothetical protein [uncultured Senegalimassilia sp.]
MAFQLFAPTTGALAEELNVVSDATAQQPGSSEGADGNGGGSSADVGAASGDDASASGDASAGGSETASDDAASGDAAAGDASEGQEPAAEESANAGDDAADAQDAPATVAASATITTVDELKKAMGDHGNVTATGETVTAITFNDAVGLRIISNAAPQLYQNAALTRGGQTGDALDLSSPDGGYTFLGFGSEDYSFKGSFDTNGTSIALATSLFNNVELNSGIHIPNLTWKGEGSEPVIAAAVVGGDQDLDVAIKIADPVSGSVQKSTAGITSALFGTVSGSLSLSATYSFSGTRKGLEATPDATGNVGLLANTVANGSTFAVESVAFPDNVASGGTVSATNGNAGLLVGEVKDGATLRVGSLNNVPTATIESKSGCAGGVVGKVGWNTGASVEVTGEINLSSLTVKGAAAAGGFIGQAIKLTLGTENKKVTCPKTVGDKDSGNVGGFIGEVSFGSSVAFTGNDQINTGDGVTLAGKADESKGVGAAIGKLNFDNSTETVSFNGGTFKSAYGNGGAAAVFGGLVGSVTGCTNSKPLHIENVTTEFALEATPNFTGGLVGWLGRDAGATLEVKNATVNCTQLRQSSKGFGGVSGCIDNGSIADINGIIVQNKEEITKGAGIAAECWRSAIRLGGVTDFSGMNIAENDTVAQIALVRADAPTLVFARGTGSDTDTSTDDCWVYKRCAAKKVDDLGGAKGAGWGYGQVIRLGGELKNLININMDEHKLEGPSTTDWKWQIGFDTETKWSEGNRVLNIKSTQDFVCLALSVQFANLWNGVYGLDPKNKEQLLGSDVTINLNADVNLSGTGIMGLGFDCANNLQTFRGTFNGNGNTVTLAIGEPYGKRNDAALASDDTTNGNGKIYRHTRLGLFAAIGGGATVNNLTVDGFIKFDNGLGVDAGSLAATITGNATLNGVTCSAAITCDDTFGNDVNIGGVAGSVSGGGTVTFDSSTKAQATINTGTALNGNTRIGGAIGYVGDCISAFDVKSLQVSGSIDSKASSTADSKFDVKSAKIAQVGGFIGCIAQGTAKNTTKVNITGLSFDSFNMTVGKNGDAKNGAGGLLGYSWGNAVVTIGDSSKNTSDSTYALKTNNASITANNSGELGGLVYAASGHWIINDYAINLSSTTINADKANVLGLLIGRGSRVENSATYGAETYSGLYLENRASWDTAYKVHDDATGNGVAINNTAINSKNSATSFDEWVGNSTRPAYGNKAGSKLMDGEWNTVVSLHTQDEKLHMSDSSGSDNSYHNRSDFGKIHNTNAWTRYYYNLDRAYKKVGNDPKNSSKMSFMDSPEYLLLWCAYLYAPSGIRSYIIPGDQQIFLGNNIGTNDGARASIDMDGYSFYPSNPASGSKVTVKNADIKFHYSEIKAKQDGNKKNSEATQHENMHCGLIRTHAGDLTVSNVTLGGTVGSVVNDAGSSSGALVCRYIYGASGAVKQISIDGLTLDGLTVDGATDKTYAPLLINEMQTYVNLSANNISTTGYANGTKAATSLFGKLGVGSTADQVTATFSAISLPSAKDNSIFTRASLLESFGYGEGKTGSAVYTFVKADQDNSKVTFGGEIDSKGEYPGKQLWYYDEDTYGVDAGLVTVDGKKANADTPQFGGYLPYVYKGKANESKVQYHEIKVNQRVPKLTTGCGTYGDPYAITKASELNAVADYVNTRSAVDGWEVTITANQSQLCQRRNGGTTDNEITYVYKQANTSSKKWEKKNGDTTDSAVTLDEDTMHTYLQSAYYSIEPKNEDGTAGTIELDAASFQGLGNLGNPFRGVIVGDLANEGQQATIAINNSTSFSKGLIPYSYGGVVKNLKVVYQSNVLAISYTPKDSNGIPGSFFGGVIGCILGGDNIIDGVNVSSQSGAAATVASANTDPLIAAAAGDTTNSYLVPIGGYVGAITGGGVIFRNSSTVEGALDPWHVAGASRYDNPYVGRVIDGYAFSELGGNKSLDNTDHNYKINNLNTDDTQCVETGDTQGRYRGIDGNDMAITTTVKDSQGLLVLSAIISSGAAGGSANTSTANDSYGTYAGSYAYFGRNTSMKNPSYQFGNQNYGKVRNASYVAVGRPGSAATDFAVATNDDRLSPGSQDVGALEQTDGNQVNSPYLVAKYATWQTGNICAAQASGMDLQFVNTNDVNTDEDIDYDMTPYGTGYTGLSGRYYSNACASAQGADRDRIVPLVATINGNGATIKVGNKGGAAYDIKEYANDDYKLTGVGALFGTVTYTSTNAQGSIGSAAADGNEATDNGGYTVQNLNFSGCNISLTYTDASGNASGSNDAEVGVGLLAGTTANNNSLADYGKYHAVMLSNCKVNGSAGVSSVGGLLGSSGYGSRKTDKDTGMVNKTGRQPSPVKLYDCFYSNMEISGVQNVGGFVGKLSSGSQGGVWTANDMDIAKDSKITATGVNARTGGVLGVNGDMFCVNVDPVTKDMNANGIAKISDVNLTATSSEGVGGLIGKVENSVYAHGLCVLGLGSSAQTPSFDAGGSSFVGGLVGRITGGDSYKFDNCTVKNIALKAKNCTGGVAGSLYVSSKQLTCNQVEVRGVTFGGDYSGGIFGNLDYRVSGPSNVVVNDSAIAGNTFVKPHSAGISGDGKGIFRLANVLIDSNNFNASKQGVLFGDTATNAMYELYAAGLDVRPAAGKTNKDLPALMNVDWGNKVENVNMKSYIAFGDYNDTLSKPDGKTLYGDEANGVTEAVSPYVTASPRSSIAVRVSDTDSTDRYLFGDGANVDLASTIKDQAGKDVASRYTYTNIGGRADSGAYQNTSGYNATSAQSYNSENSDSSKQVAKDSDFKVLEIPGQDTTTVTNYLNLVTNGGFSDAVRLNGGSGKQYVTAKAEKFVLKQMTDDTKVFVKSSDPASLSVVGNGTNSMQFRASSNWDNDKGQFTLLSVTFNDGANHTYKVQVPIVVKRLFEVNFAATYTYGTNFKASDYSNKNAHVLTGVGDAMTGYLTWTYNKALSADTEYGWNTYLQGGGSMKSPNKTLLFGGDETKGTLPVGTQLTLVDTANNNKEYHYTVGTNGAASVALTDFADSDGSDAKHYEEQWLSELMGVKASGPTASGAWVKTNADDPNAGARIKTATGYDYFRPWASGDAGDRYDLALEGGSEPHPSENFFLVVRSTATVNGYTGTLLSSGVNTRINYVKRSNESETDSHDNTASTYGVASGYGQTLVDNRQLDDGSDGTKVMSVDTVNSFTMDVTDTVDCGNNEYNSSDTLYYQLNSSLSSHNGSTPTGASGYPSGTSGTYSFYVKVGETYYKPSKTVDSAGNVKWSWEPAGEGEAAVSGKSWSADGSDMQLVLSDGEGTPIDLSGIRKIATDAKTPFSIQMKADLQMSGPACQNAIAASEDASAYTKPTYRSFLSPHADTLSTSTMAEDNEGKMRYYRKGGGASTIALTATKKTQLGINVDDLGTADGTIALAATYDLSKLSGADEKLGKAEKATFTLTLQKRGGEGKYEDVSGIGDYLSVQQCTQLGMDKVSVDGDSIVFADAASNGILATRDGNSPILRLGFVVKVNTNVESAQHFYANYRLVMTAHLSGEGVNDTPVNASGSIAGYANSDYVTYTLTKVHMEGINRS